MREYTKVINKITCDVCYKIFSVEDINDNIIREFSFWHREFDGSQNCDTIRVLDICKYCQRTIVAKILKERR